MIQITEQPIDTTALLASVSDGACGAQVLFVGTTRQWTRHADGRELETSHLVYEAYESMALAKLQELEVTVRERWAVKHVAIVHRVGCVAPTEPSVAVAVSSPHRSESFEAARWLIDTLKHEVPIWKQEHYVQSGTEWIHPTAGSCSCPESIRVEGKPVGTDADAKSRGRQTTTEPSPMISQQQAQQ